MTDKGNQLISKPGTDDLTATVKPIQLQPGLYAFFVINASPESWNDGGMSVPAIHVAAGPGTAAESIAFIPALAERGTWLFQSGDALVVNVKSGPATILITSLRAPGSGPLAVEMERISKAAAFPPAGAFYIPEGAAPDAPPACDVRLEILAHIQNCGDMRFVDAPWAGRVAPGLAMEAFAITAQAPLTSGDLEYRGLTATGFETPWIGNGGLCGTRGKATALVGFSVRLRDGVAAQFDCEYSGYFRSGGIAGPLRNGTQCRSILPGDPLEGIRVRLVAKEKVAPDDDCAAPEDPFPQAKMATAKFGKIPAQIRAGAPRGDGMRKSRKPTIKAGRRAPPA